MATPRLAALLAVVMIGLASCADNQGEPVFGVTQREGTPQLIVALCGQPPPATLVVARGPTSGMPPWADQPRDEHRIFQVDRSDWDSNELMIPLDTQDVPPFMEGIWVAYNHGSSPAMASLLMPEEPWPAYPLALASPFGERPVRLDAEDGELCDER